MRGSGDPDAWLDDDASPPECPPGWRTGPPDFVGVGAQKAGTTWWFKLLTAHPDVHETGGQRPELHFFDRFVTGWPGPDDVERYHRFFPRPPGAMAGEKTPIYMACHWVPRMLRDAAPETRPIVLLRDPIARYVSGRTHEDARLARVHRGVRDPANEVRWVSDAFAKGLYAQQLGWLYAAFPREQVLVLQYERCVADPAAQLARTYAFLGLDPFEPPSDELARPRNVTRREKLELEPERRTMLVDLYRDDVARLATLVPDIDPALWPDFS
ncbi:MAG: sulfotransferase [Chloroflexi bacterium]|nr:sulfotransferase [Chloroflexota bacterium]